MRAISLSPTKIPQYQYNYKPQFKGKNKPVNTEKLYNDSFEKNNSNLQLILATVMLASAISTNIDTIKDMSKVESVEPSQKYFDSRKAALEYAFEKVKVPLNEKKPYEYGVTISDETNEILGEFKGDSTSVVSMPSVSTIFYKILGIKTDKFTSIHGHPENEENYTPSFSFQDFRSFNKLENESTMIVVTKDGKYFKLSKNDDFKQLNKKTLDAFEKDYHHMRNSSKNATRIDYLNGSTGKIVSDYPIVHAFWKKAGEIFNFEYTTDYNSESKNNFFLPY